MLPARIGSISGQRMKTCFKDISRSIETFKKKGLKSFNKFKMSRTKDSRGSTFMEKLDDDVANSLLTDGSLTFGGLIDGVPAGQVTTSNVLN